MAVIPTGAIYKALFFDGESSRNYGVYITGEAVYNSPERDVEMIKIPGRNGEFALDNGRFENIEVTYPAGIFANNETDFAAAISDFRNFLASRVGYCRLEDEYNPNEYRMAVYKSGLNVDPAKLEAGEFSITFDCKPQRWLKDGETAVAIGEWGETETASGDIVTVENPNGILAVKSLEVDLEPIQDLNGYDKPWVGGAGKNKLVLLADEIKAVNTAGTWSGNTYTVSGMTYTLNTDSYGHIVSVTINGTTTTYPTFRIPINGLTVGQSYKLYRGNFRSRLIKDNATVNDASSAYTFTAESGDYWVVLFTGASTISNVTVQPMVCLDSETSTFEPYENICPISGHTSVDTYRTGKNLLDVSTAEIGTAWNGARNSARAKLVIPLRPNTDYVLSMNGTISVDGVFRTFSNVIPSPTQPANVTFPYAFNSSSNTYLTLGFNKTAISQSDVDALKLQIELGSEATAYEPYQGTTYTTELGRAVYGGTLDVVSGVLTVEYGAFTFDGDENLSESGTNSFRYYDASIADGDFTADINVISSWLENHGGVAGAPSFAQSGGANNRNIYFYNAKSISGVTDLTSFKTYLSSNPLTVVYKLENPITVQLTAQQIDLLTGDNNIWSDGAVTLEYGQNPSVLFNPTLFESSPLLETAGSGTIQFNGYSIDFEGVPIGEVVVGEHGASSSSSSSSDNPYTKTVTLDTTLLNIGDAIYPEIKDCIIGAIMSMDNANRRYTALSVASSNNVLDANISWHISKKYTATFRLYPDFGSGFAYGTSKTITCSAVFNYGIDTSTATNTETVQVTIAYDGASTYTITVSRTGTLATHAVRGLTAAVPPTMYGDSSKPNNDPIFIDCDLGEAYTNEGGVYRSLNQYIDLGSELPKLGVGENEVTFDSTITELKITPRWWKV